MLPGPDFVVFIGRDGHVREIYQHYTIKADFESSLAEIVRSD